MEMHQVRYFLALSETLNFTQAATRCNVTQPALTRAIRSLEIELGGELRYWLYRQYKRQHTDVVGIFLVRELNTEKNYNDSWELTGGARVHDLAAVPGLDLMMGLQYDKSPAPAKTVTLDQPSFSHWGLHSGARYSFGRYRVGASYIHYWYRIPTIEDSVTMPPSNIKGHGSNNIVTLSLEVAL